MTPATAFAANNISNTTGWIIHRFPGGNTPLSAHLRMRLAACWPANAPEKVFPPLVRQFLEYLKLEKHFSDYTVKSYGADLIQFGQFLTGEIGLSHSNARRCRRCCHHDR